MKKTKIVSGFLSAALAFSSMTGLIQKAPADTLSDTSVTAEAAAQRIYYRTTGTYVNVRYGPTTQSKVLKTLPKKYTFVESYESPKNGWLKTVDGYYISANYVERLTPYAYKAELHYTTGTFVYERTGPGTNYPYAFRLVPSGFPVYVNVLPQTRKTQNGFVQLTDGLWISQQYITK